MTRITNFGGNVRFQPAARYEPRSEEEVLAILERHARGRIRALGSLHSWSDVVACEDAVIDLRRFDGVEVERGEDGSIQATVGAGCTLGRLLRVLRARAGATLPSLGAVTVQRVAGAISTGTHGSGAPSLSNLVLSVRAAAYDPDTGRPRIYEWSDGPELRAARCALGCMGVILSLRVRAVPAFCVEETVVRRATIDEILAEEDRFPLQQILLLPYSWTYLVFQRRVVEGDGAPKPSRTAPLHLAYTRLYIDAGLHLLLRALLRWGRRPEVVRWFYCHVLPRSFIRGWTVVGRSDHVLTFRHDLFRHEEMEVFVPARHLREAIALVRHVTSVFAGIDDDAANTAATDLERVGMLEELRAARGSYTHHYPLFFRRVLPDDTLISMTAGAGEPYYSISFFTYLRPEARQPFRAYASFLARSLCRLYGARLHWGKYFPLSVTEVEPLYPRLEEFRQICRRVDPHGVFRNAFTRRVLGL